MDPATTPRALTAIAAGDAVANLAIDAQSSISLVKALSAAIDLAIDEMGSIGDDNHRKIAGHIAAYAILIAQTAEKAEATCTEIECSGYDVRKGFVA